MKQRLLLFLIIVGVMFFISCTDSGIESVEPSLTPTQQPTIFDEEDVVFELSSISPFFDADAVSHGYNYYDDYIAWHSEIETTFGIKLSINSVYDLNMFSPIHSSLDIDSVYIAMRENINNGNISGLYKIGTVNQLKRLAKEGLILPFDPYLKDNQNWLSLPEDYRNAMTFDGMTYGLPFTSFESTFVRGIRQDWLDELHLKQPTTINQLYEVLQAFTFDDPDNDGINNTIGTNYNGTSGIQDIFASFDARLNPAGKVLPTWNPNTNIWEDSMLKPEMAECLSFLRSCYVEGLINRTDSPGVGNQFYTGYSGSYCSPYGYILFSSPDKILLSRPDTIDPVISVIPALSHIIDQNINCYFTVHMMPIVLTKNSNYPDTTLNTFIDVFIFDKLGFFMGKYGLEGAGYEQQDNIIILKTNKVDDSRYPYEGPNISFGRQLRLHIFNPMTDYTYETGNPTYKTIDNSKMSPMMETIKNSVLCYYAPGGVVNPDYTQTLIEKVDFMGDVTNKIINDVILGYATFEEALVEYKKQSSAAGMQEFIDQQNDKLGVSP